MGTLASGSIDLNSLKVAGEANKYITAIDENGIKVHAANKVDLNYTQITSDGMEIFKEAFDENGEPILDDEDNPTNKSIAIFGDTIQITAKNNSYLQLSSDSMITKNSEGVKGFEINFNGPSATTYSRIASEVIAYTSSATTSFSGTATNGAVLYGDQNILIDWSPASWIMNKQITQIQYSSTDGWNHTNNRSLTPRDADYYNYYGEIFWGPSFTTAIPFNLNAPLYSSDPNCQFIYGTSKTTTITGIVQYTDTTTVTVTITINYDSTEQSITITTTSSDETTIQTSRIFIPEIGCNRVVNNTTAVTAGTRAKGSNIGAYSATFGEGLYAQNYSVAMGKFNYEDSDSKFALSIGNGTGEETVNRSNAAIIDWNGNYMSQGMAGVIQMFAGRYPPKGWLLCDGDIVSKATYPALFAAIGHAYKKEDDDTESWYFRLPDLVGRMPIGAGTSETVSNPTTRDLGAKAGSERVTLTAEQMPVHGHQVHTWVRAGTLGTAKTWTNYGATETTTPNGSQLANGTWQSSSFQAAQGGNGDQTGRTNAAGNGQSHGNMPPYLAINFIIATGDTDNSHYNY